MVDPSSAFRAGALSALVCASARPSVLDSGVSVTGFAGSLFTGPFFAFFSFRFFLRFRKASSFFRPASARSAAQE